MLASHCSRLVIGAASLALLAGCTSAVAIPPAQPHAAAAQSLGRNVPGAGELSGPGFASPELQAGVPSAGAEYVSDYHTNSVYVFNTAGKMTGRITGFSAPNGIAFDAATSRLYVADFNNSVVKVYAGATLKATLADAGEYPADPAISSAGVVAVTNFTTTSGGAGSVSFYAKGATKPCATVSNAAFGRIAFDAFDKSGNLYVDGQSTPTGGTFVAGKIAGGCKAKSIAVLSTSNTIGFPGGIQISSAGNVLIDDQGAGTVYTYGPNLGTPKATTVLTGSNDAVSIALTKSGGDVWTADLSGFAGEWKYPAGGAIVKQIALPSGAQPLGIALNPNAQP